MQQETALQQQDESRLIVYLIFLISRLLASDAGLWELVEPEMNRLLPAALAVVGEVTDH